MIKLKLNDREISLPKNSKYLLPGNRSTLGFSLDFQDFLDFSIILKISKTDILHVCQFHHHVRVHSHQILNNFFVFRKKYFLGWVWVSLILTRGNISRVERQKKMDIISSQRSWDYDSLIFTIYHLTHLMNLAMHFFKARCKSYHQYRYGGSRPIVLEYSHKLATKKSKSRSKFGKSKKRPAGCRY